MDVYILQIQLLNMRHAVYHPFETLCQYEVVDADVREAKSCQSGSRFWKTLQQKIQVIFGRAHPSNSQITQITLTVNWEYFAELLNRLGSYFVVDVDYASQSWLGRQSAQNCCKCLVFQPIIV